MTRARPSEVFDAGLQQERTSLAWERTAISIMVAGLLLSRFAATERFWLLATVGMAQVVLGAGLLVWAASHYEDLHGSLRNGGDILFPVGARVVGTVTVVGTGAALVAALFAVFST